MVSRRECKGSGVSGSMGQRGRAELDPRLTNCMVSRGECKGSGVSGSMGQRGRAELEPRLTLSMDGKMYGFTRRV